MSPQVPPRRPEPHRYAAVTVPTAGSARTVKRMTLPSQREAPRKSALPKTSAAMGFRISKPGRRAIGAPVLQHHVLPMLAEDVPHRVGDLPQRRLGADRVVDAR